MTPPEFLIILSAVVLGVLCFLAARLSRWGCLISLILAASVIAAVWSLGGTPYGRVGLLLWIVTPMGAGAFAGFLCRCGARRE